MHKVGMWERYVFKILNILMYQILIYLVITIGRSYIFKYTVPTVK